MQQILEKMFTWKYFEPTLFVTIGVLLVLLFIVFFVGNKDKKSNNNEVGQEGNNPSSDTAFQDIAPTESVEVSEPVSEVKTDDTVSVVTETPVEDIPPVIISETKEEAANEEIPVPPVVSETPVEDIPLVVSEEKQEQPDFEVFGNNPDFTSSVEDAFNVTKEEKEVELPEVKEKTEENAVELPKDKEETQEEEIEVPDFKESFNELASSINKELDEISRLSSDNRKTTIKEEAKKVELPNSIEATPIEDTSKFAPSEVFSSVYVDREEEKPVLEEETEPDIPFFDSMKFEDKKPDMELPAMRKDEEETGSTDDNEVNVPDFSVFDNETFNIK